MTVLVGLDLGERRVGVAVSDPAGKVALPEGVLDGSDEARLVEEIASLVREKGASRIVIGLPRNMDGSVGERARAALRFAGLLREKLLVPVDTWDERLSSSEAERTIRYGRGKETHKGGRPTRTRRRRGEKGDVDRIAAVLILQAYLDRRENEGA